MRTYGSSAANVARKNRIFPITIETPYGQVMLAYRVDDKGVPGRPFLVSFDLLALHPAASKFWFDLNLEELGADLWWSSLGPEGRAAEEALHAGPVDIAPEFKRS